MCDRKKGSRVFMLYSDDIPGGKTIRRRGTLMADEGLWDYSDVRFDDFPNFTEPILCYYLFSEGGEHDSSDN